jgi:hypothetical protein
VKPGGSHAKGSAFERDTCQRLSLWISKGKRDDLLARNVLSGGQFTVARIRGEVRGSPGDLTAVDPMAIPFIQAFSVECKHYRDLGLSAYVFDKKGNSFINQTVALCKRQARQAGKQWLLVAKQDRKPALIFLEPPTALFAGTCSIGRLQLHRVVHTFHHGTKHEASMFLFDDFLGNVDAKRFIKGPS